MTINEINQGNKAVEFISERIKDVLSQVTSKDEEVVRKLAADRKFSVDGKASKRLADLVEGYRKIIADYKRLKNK